MNNKLVKIWLNDGRKITEYYQQKIRRKGGVSAASLDWRTKREHRMFLRAAWKHIDADGIHSIFDVGCGDGRSGAMIESLVGRSPIYRGIDLVPEFVLHGLKENPSLNIKVGDFIDTAYQPKQKYDLIQNLGGLNSHVHYPNEYARAVIEKMLRYSRRYVIFNLLIDPKRKYFPKSILRPFGHIGYYHEKTIMPVLEIISRKNKCHMSIEKKSVFPGCQDLFVTYEHEAAKPGHRTV